MSIEVNILVAGKNQANVVLAKEAFGPKGYQVIPTNEISLGLFLAQKNFPDLIIADAEFRQGDGLSFLRELKVDPELAPIPFLFLIDPILSQLDEDEAIEYGAIQILHHPCAANDLAHLAEPLIQQRRLTKGRRTEQTPE